MSRSRIVFECGRDLSVPTAWPGSRHKGPLPQSVRVAHAQLGAEFAQRAFDLQHKLGPRGLHIGNGDAIGRFDLKPFPQARRFKGEKALRAFLAKRYAAGREFIPLVRETLA